MEKIKMFKNLMLNKMVQNEVKRIKNVTEDAEGRNVDYDIDLFLNATKRVSEIVEGKKDKVFIDSDMWDECHSSLDKIIEHFNLSYGEVNEQNGQFSITK